MGYKFVRTMDMTDEDRKQSAEMGGKLLLWIMEHQSVDYMAKQLNMTPNQVWFNIEETMYTLVNYVWGRSSLIKFIQIFRRK